MSADRFRGCLLGLACGDAVGTTVEFSPRGTFEPVTDMVGGGPFGLKPGQWTDDTSMALCLATSLLECAGFDPEDQMTRYCRWWREGYLSSTGACFDIGGTVRDALSEFRHSGRAFAGSTDPHSAGNGSIMRLAPVALYYFPDVDRAVHYCAESSRTTHGCTEAVDACRLLGRMLCAGLAGGDKRSMLEAGARFAAESELAPAIASIARRYDAHRRESDVRGSGYVVESLDAAVWAFGVGDGFEQAILRAVNLGDDADTTAAICGQLAGACYGQAGIPQHWLGRLEMRSEMESLADALRPPAPAASA